MSVRIYQLSKDLNMENKELIELLKGRGYEVKSASSTISNIDAEALITELKPKEDAAPAAAEEPAKKEAPQMPTGKFVKTAAEVQQTKEDVKAPAATVKPAPKPTVKAAPATPAPTVKAAPATPPAPKAAPAPQPKAAPSIPPTPTPAPATPPAPPTADVPQDKAEDTDQETKILTIKPPIVVRDFAEQIGLKPFKLISELMEKGIFANLFHFVWNGYAHQVGTSPEKTFTHSGNAIWKDYTFQAYAPVESRTTNVCNLVG